MTNSIEDPFAEDLGSAMSSARVTPDTNELPPNTSSRSRSMAVRRSSRATALSEKAINNERQKTRKVTQSRPSPRPKPHSTPRNLRRKASNVVYEESGSSDAGSPYGNDVDDPFSQDLESPVKRRRGNNANSIQVAQSARVALRHEIATKTANKRHRFFVSKKDLFLPLLPESNFIQRLVKKAENGELEILDDKGEEDTIALGGKAAAGEDKEAHVSDKIIDMDEAEEVDAESRRARAAEITIHEYEPIEQPKGIKAIMKEYQLSGLSFLVYLHRNGLSGILGDEMGLGKTLQTLSLFQWLKENEPTTSDDLIRPCLVVCPLSVLSSWMAEASRWTPGLKVLRFHGPTHERSRLKEVAEGKIDLQGRQLRHKPQKARKSGGKTSTGAPIISLDSESEDDLELDKRNIDLIVTTYETYQAENAWFKRAFVWKYVVLDEGHKIKNELTAVSRSLQGLQAEMRLILTGTPLQNDMTELWALLHWLYPEVFTTVTQDLFSAAFNLTIGQVRTSVLDDARRLLELVMLRRMKNSPGVNLNLPPKTDILLFVPLTPMQRFWYERLLSRMDKGILEQLFKDAKGKEESARLKDAEEDKKLKLLEIPNVEDVAEQELNNEAIDDKWQESKEILRKALETGEEKTNNKSDYQKLMNLLMQLRKCCNHPYTLPGAQPDPFYLGDHLIQASGKFVVLNKLVDELVLKQEKKILIFSGFTMTLNLIEDLMIMKSEDGNKFDYCRLDGGTCRARRNLGIRQFNKHDSSCKVMLISTRAGGLGINLATASDVVMFDHDWNPQITLQAEARAHRIGQKNPVTVYKLCSQGTVEEQMMGRIQKKLYLSAKVMESMRDIHGPESKQRKSKSRQSASNTDDMPQMNAGQLMALVRRGAQTLVHPEANVDEMISWDWDTILEKCRDKPADLLVKPEVTKDELDESEEAKWLSQMERVECRVFDGKKYAKEKGRDTNADIRLDWERADRRVGKNTTVMVDGYAINKESMRCKDWEAVPTMTSSLGPPPPKRKKRKVNNEEYCHICKDGGTITLCTGCPRSYHLQCLPKETRARAKSGMGQFFCDQHQCYDCEQKNSDAGGMLYRCRWCPRAYCEDCLDFDNTDLLGDTLREFEMLDFGAVDQATFICCPDCKDYLKEDPGWKYYIETEMEAWFDMKGEELRLAGEGQASEAVSLTDDTSVETSGVSTPTLEVTEIPTTGRKRKSMNDLADDSHSKSERISKRKTSSSLSQGR